MNSTIKNIVVVTVGLIAAAVVFIVIVGAIGNLVEKTVDSSVIPTAPTAQSNKPYENTARNSFVSGCDKTGEATTQECTCSWNSLNALYGEGWWGDSSGYSAITNRILADGYNSTETDAMISCF